MRVPIYQVDAFDWAERLGKPEIRANQASARGGEMTCRIKGERVELEGACIFYMEGEAEI